VILELSAKAEDEEEEEEEEKVKKHERKMKRQTLIGKKPMIGFFDMAHEQAQIHELYYRALNGLWGKSKFVVEMVTEDFMRDVDIW
jgi:hypothetical protein